MFSMAFRVVRIFAMTSLALGLTGASLAAQTPARQSPINRIGADYLCTLNEDARQQVAFLIPSKSQAPRIWLTGQGKMMGLEAQVGSFGFQSCQGCFFAEARYSFSGSLNRLSFETRPASPVRLALFRQMLAGGSGPPGSDDLPPGSEDAPPGSDLPPGSDDQPPGSGEEPPGSGETPPDSGVDPTPKGPLLEIHYREVSQVNGRVIFDSEGFCEAL